MKFLVTKNLLEKNNLNFNENYIPNLYNNIYKFHILVKLGYLKKFVKNRKVLLNIKKGITKTEKKNSLKRDKNNTIIQQFMNIMLRGGNKNTLFKHFDKSIENFYFILNDENEEFLKYKDYLPLNFLVNNFIEYNDFNYILENFLPGYFSLFDIKTIKNNKKRTRNPKKYSHEITYISENKRLKNLLKIINVYSENFKNYELWERLFWLFIVLITDKKKSNLIKRRSYIYKKSIKFFINKKNK